MEDWLGDLAERGVAYTKSLNPVTDVLYEPSDVASWHNEGLPSGGFAEQNASILLAAPRWPLIVDPQQQGVQWVRTRGRKGSLQLLQQTSKSYYSKLVSCLENGGLAVVEDIADLDPLSKPLMEVPRSSGTRRVWIGDAEVTVHRDFSLVLHTALLNPEFRPEVFAQATVINFGVTESGLQEQLLGVVVNLERPELEQSRLDLLHKMNEMTISLRKCEDLLLAELSSATGDVLENESLVSTLEQAKRQSTEIAAAFIDAHETKEKIYIACNLYAPVAARGALLFFSLNKLHLVDVVYQYSMESYLAVFTRAIRDAQALSPRGSRVPEFIETVTREVYAFVDRSLFSRHRIVFATLVTIAVMEQQGTLLPSHTAFLLRAPTKYVIDVPEAAAEWLSKPQWGAIQALSELDGGAVPFAGILDDFADNSRWRQWAECEQPEVAKLPGEWKALPPNAKTALCALPAPRPCHCGFDGDHPFVSRHSLASRTMQWPSNNS